LTLSNDRCLRFPAKSSRHLLRAFPDKPLGAGLSDLIPKAVIADSWRIEGSRYELSSKHRSGVVTQHSSVKVAAGPRTNFSRDLADPAPSLRSPALDLDPDTSFEDVRVGRNPCRLRRGAIATTSVMRMLRLRTSDVPR
jgi:hypothetical protein